MDKELYCKDSNGDYIPWKEIEEGIYEIRSISRGKALSLTKASDLSEAITLSSFSKLKLHIARDLEDIMFDPIMECNTPINISTIFDIIDKNIINYYRQENKTICTRPARFIEDNKE